MFIFKPNKWPFIQEWLIVNVLSILAIFLKDSSTQVSIIILITVNFLLILYFLFRRKITIIEINDNVLTISSKRFSKMWKLATKADENNILSAKIEYKIGARGRRLYYLNVYKNEQSICKIDLEKDGWSESILEDVRNHINHMNK